MEAIELTCILHLHVSYRLQIEAGNRSLVAFHKSASMNFIAEMPPVTKFWLGSIAAVTMATSMGKVSPYQVVYWPGKMWSQPQRFLTLLLFFGAPLANFFNDVLQVKMSISELEQNFYTSSAVLPRRLTRNKSPEHLAAFCSSKKTVDFTYFLLQIIVTMYFLLWLESNLLDFIHGDVIRVKMSGRILEMALLYILCKQLPELDLRVFMIPVKAKYVPAALFAISAIMDSKYPEILRTLAWDWREGFHVLAYWSLLQDTVISIFLGHTWWYLRFFHATEVAALESSAMRTRLTQSFEPFGVPENWLGYLVVPPWYWFYRGVPETEEEQRRREHLNGTGPIGGEGENAVEADAGEQLAQEPLNDPTSDNQEETVENHSGSGTASVHSESGSLEIHPPETSSADVEESLPTEESG